MKRHLCILLSFLMAFSMLVGCGKGNDETVSSSGDVTSSSSSTTNVETTSSDVSIATAKVYLTDESMKELNKVSTMSINTYLVARSYFDMVCNYDFSTGSEEEFKELVNKAIKSFEECDKLSASMVNISEINESLVKDPDVKGKYEEAKLVIEKSKKFENPFVIKAYAAEESDAVREARKIVEMYDSAPQLQGIKTLAKQLNTDSKHAYATLKQSLAILEGHEYSSLAEKEDAALKTCMTLKAAGTTAGLTISVMTAGSATTTIGAVMEYGGVILNGVNTYCEVGIAGSTLITGDDNNVIAATLNHVESKFETASQIVGLYGCVTANGQNLETFYNAFSFITPETYNIVENGKVLGGLIEFNEVDGSMNYKFMGIPVSSNKEDASKNFEEISKEIEIPDSLKDEACKLLESDFGNINEEESDTITNADEIINLNASCDPNQTSYICDDVLEDAIENISSLAEDADVDISSWNFDYTSEYTDDEIESDTNPFGDTEIDIIDEVDVTPEDEPSDYVEENVTAEDGIPTADELAGYYEYYGEDFNGNTLLFSQATFTSLGNAIHINDTLLEGDFDMPYNPSTGKASVSEDGASAIFKFWKENGKIKSSLTLDYGEFGTFYSYATKK